MLACYRGWSLSTDQTESIPSYIWVIPFFPYNMRSWHIYKAFVFMILIECQINTYIKFRKMNNWAGKIYTNESSSAFSRLFAIYKYWLGDVRNIYVLIVFNVQFNCTFFFSHNGLKNMAILSVESSCQLPKFHTKTTHV